MQKHIEFEERKLPTCTRAKPPAFTSIGSVFELKNRRGTGGTELNLDIIDMPGREAFVPPRHS